MGDALVYEFLTIYWMHRCAFHILWLINYTMYQWYLDIILQRADYNIIVSYIQIIVVSLNIIQ